ncbi:MAG TPA: radical SAM protein [Candidatus Avalokitesvara rifleensis]|uniref:radical SAM protein n=1 Tax=Candidatus Avalokitesvara rifleensis TaxID=3367620 RepID=UPI004028CA16
MKAHLTRRLTDVRLRRLHPLVDGDGPCTLLYDLERNFVIEVPVELSPRIIPALVRGNMDKSLAKWLAGEDLLTCEKQPNYFDEKQLIAPQVTDISLDMSGNCNMSCVYCFENNIDSRLGPMSYETAMASLDFIFRKATNSPHIVLHFGSGEPLLHFDLLRKIVAKVDSRTRASGQKARYELTTNATLVTQEIACFLRDHPFNVRVSCDGPAAVHNKFRPLRGGKNSYQAVERGLTLLLEYVPDRLTVNSVLSGGTRLSKLWSWAKEIGLLHYCGIKVGAYVGRDFNLRETELHHFRTDLQDVCNDMFASLEAGHAPIDYQPITKVVRRLIIPEAIPRFCGVASSYLGVASNGRIYPCFRYIGLKGYDLGDVWHDVDDKKRLYFLRHEATSVDSRPVCQECWARYLCGGGCYADSTVYGPDRLKPHVHHCPFWQTEIELAIRFYNRLLKTNPIYCLKLFGNDTDQVFDSIDIGFHSLQHKNC